MHYVSAIPHKMTEPRCGSAPRGRRFIPKSDEIRCECLVCNSHAFAPRDRLSAGRCGNCGSQELQPLTTA